MIIKPLSYGTYEVRCEKCKEEFSVTLYPEYCCMCGEKLIPGTKSNRAKSKGPGIRTRKEGL